ncbi:MAG TPA: hydroxyacid dehydrogenase [Chitinophagaceae bacterium]|nr:hydroxyacid dehydrogenase [Chitinophagaceae bacterium]
MIPVNSYAAMSANTPLEAYNFERRAVGPDDVQIDILFCGVCHSDLHQVKNEWGGSQYPMVPGHEIVGTVLSVGANVTKFKVGDLAGLGVMVDSCKTCKTCAQDLEQYCEEGFVGTYNNKERNSDKITMGGYSTKIVVDEYYTFKIAHTLPLAAVAPLLCAGITTYSPLVYAGVKKGMKVAVVGLGGLGHMGVKFAVSFGAEVTVISTSPSKEADAKKLGATHFLVSTDKEAMSKYSSYFDVVLDAISANHDYTTYLNLLGIDGKLMVVGLPIESPKVQPFSLVTNRRSVIGSCIGGMKETQEMLDYCAEHNIVSEIEVIPMQKINEAYDRMLKGDVKYRFVIDLASLK